MMQRATRDIDHVIPALLALVLAPPAARLLVLRRLVTDWLGWTRPPAPREDTPGRGSSGFLFGRSAGAPRLPAGEVGSRF